MTKTLFSTSQTSHAQRIINLIESHSTYINTLFYAISVRSNRDGRKLRDTGREGQKDRSAKQPGGGEAGPTTEASTARTALGTNAVDDDDHDGGGGNKGVIFIVIGDADRDRCFLGLTELQFGGGAR